VELREEKLPVPGPVQAACEVLGFAPLYVANEGILVAFVASGAAEATVVALREHPLGEHAAVIGSVVEAHPGLVALKASIGGSRVVDVLPGDQLPRIC